MQSYILRFFSRGMIKAISALLAVLLSTPSNENIVSAVDFMGPFLQVLVVITFDFLFSFVDLLAKLDTSWLEFDKRETL